MARVPSDNSVLECDNRGLTIAVCNRGVAILDLLNDPNPLLPTPLNSRVHFVRVIQVRAIFRGTGTRLALSCRIRGKTVPPVGEGSRAMYKERRSEVAKDN